jgi:hypothetical protein
MATLPAEGETATVLLAHALVAPTASINAVRSSATNPTKSDPPWATPLDVRPTPAAHDSCDALRAVPPSPTKIAPDPLSPKNQTDHVTEG